MNMSNSESCNTHTHSVIPPSTWYGIVRSSIQTSAWTPSLMHLLSNATYLCMWYNYSCKFCAFQIPFQVPNITPALPPYLLINHSSAHKDYTVALCKHADNTLNHTINLTVHMRFVWVLYLTCTSKLLCPFSGGFPDKTYSASSWLWAFMVTMCTQNRVQQLC